MLRVRGVDALQAAEDLFLPLFFGLYLGECRVVLERGPREGRVLDLVVDFPAFALQSQRQGYMRNKVRRVDGRCARDRGRTVL